MPNSKLSRTESYLLVGRNEGGSATRRQRVFPSREAVDRASKRWAAEGRTTQWLWGPAETEDGDRPLIFEPGSN